MRTAILTLTLLVAACTRCTPAPAPVPPPQPAPDGGSAGARAVDAGGDADAACGHAAACADVCCHLRNLGCSAGADLHACLDYCHQNQSGPVLGRMDLAACVAATRCEDCR